jgi:aminopeptidase N
MNLISTIVLAALWLFPLSSYALAEIAMPLNELAVEVEPGNNAIKGVSRISVPTGQSAKIRLAGIKVTAVSVRDKALAVEPGTESITFTPASAEDILKIEYRAEYRALPEGNSSNNAGAVKGNRIAPEGILLADNWHPAVDGASLYRLTAVLPSGFEGISEADEVHIRELADNRREFLFAFRHPLWHLTLIAGRYQVETEKHGDTEIITCFFPEDSGLSKTYREFTGKYLDMYEKYLGKYPYRRFAIVENFLSAGYSFPTFTLIGKDILKMPFMLDTSLGHEVLHQWLGNLVYPDDKSGNWSEGLTTYLADHRYEELKDKGWDYRKQILISFGSYVTSEKDFPLQSFRGREDRESAAIGYGKSAMVFHMLRRMVGDEIFFSSLREFVEKYSFRTASWSDIRAVFESGYGKDLEWFFRQWVEESGLPELEITDLELKYKGTKAVVSFNVDQKGKNYKFFLTVAVQLREGEVRKVFTIEKEPRTLVEIEIEAEDTPVSLIIDDNYDLFRKLSRDEIPPVVSRLLGDEKKIFVVPQDKEGLYAGLSGFLKGEGYSEKKEQELSYEDIKNCSLLIPGVGTSAVKRLLGKLEEQAADFYLLTRDNPFNENGVIAVVGGHVPSEFTGYMQKLTHYGKYGNLSFKEEKNILKTIDETERGIRSVVSEATPGVEIPRLTDIYGVIDKTAGKDIIYVGEGHDKFEHHRVQLQFIKELHKKYKKIAIGMEMFQKPFQQALDDYIAGRTDEKTFLKKTEYFKQWGYDYNLYREILLFARGYRIPVIALNIPKKLVSKVSREGLLALNADELKEVPEYFDISDMEYYGRLRDSFERHANAKEMNFDFFYQAQVLWDESMARNLDEFMSKNPEYKVVVLAGEGHMAFGSGIPRRAFRLNKREYAVILNGADVDQDIADFVLFPPPVSLPESPKLGVLLKEEDNKVIVNQFTSDSVAKQAGLKENDIILSLEDTLVESVDDMRIFLLSKKKGDEITVKVLRERFLLGPGEREFKVIL